ncbi:MAG: VOC family protein [Acidimicrobiales bacterium]
MAEIAALAVADPAELWQNLGFTVNDGVTWVSRIRHDLGAPGAGVTAWILRGVDALTELPINQGKPPDGEPTPDHPNGVTGLDHVVIATPDLARTVAAFEAAGLLLRRVRESGTPERPTNQAFFRMGEVIVEVVGSPSRTGPGPARFYGLAFTVSDLDATARLLGDRLRPASDAVQRGRRIATLDRAVGSTVPIAFMSSEP